MTSFRVGSVTVAGFVVLVLAARPAEAESRVRLTYEVAAGCPVESDFIAATANRGGRFDGTEAVARAHGIDVSIRRNTEGFAGTLRVEHDEETSALREVHAADCAEVVKGLAVVAAIALGGSADVAPVEAAVVEPLPKDAVEPPTVQSERPKDPDPSTRTQATPSAAPKSPPEEPWPPRHVYLGNPKGPLHVEAGTVRFDDVRTYTLAAGVEFGILPWPTPMPRYDFTTSIAHFVTPPGGLSFLVGQVIQVHWSWLGPATYQTNDYSTTADGLLAGASTCRPLTYDTEGLVLLACGSFDVGWVHLATKKTDGAATQSKDAGLGTAGLGLDAQYNLGSLVHLALRVGGNVQFGNVAGELPGGGEAFKASLFGAYGTLGLGMHFR